MNDASPSSPHNGGVGVQKLDSESAINLTVLDPPRWGWTAAGGIADLLPPHERARRKEAKKTFLRLKRKRDTADPMPERDIECDGSNERLHVALETCDAAGHNNELEAAAGGPLKGAELQVACGDSSVAKLPENATKHSARKKKGASARDKSKAESRRQAASKPVRFSAWNAEQGVLDMYTYHRGREGLERRDEFNGDLLCDVQPTDTSFGKEAPTLIAHINIEFPLEDAVTGDLAEVRYYRESLTWDLGDPETPTPMCFASDIAAKFGLSYLQTLELAESIQNQLQTWVRNHCGFAQPLFLKDALGATREPPSSVAYSLYGDVIGTGQGGKPLSTLNARKMKPSIRASAAARAPSTIETGTSTEKAPTKRRRESKVAATESAEKVEEVYVHEVLRRLRVESTKRIAEARRPDCIDREIQQSRDVFCHICQDRKECGATFACGSDTHVYCDSHLAERHGLSLHDNLSPSKLDYCPICALDCPCKACTERLQVVALNFKAKTLQQGVAATDTVAENLIALANQGASETEPTRKVAKRRRSDFSRRRTVSKLPLSEFPREVYNGSDLDPGTELDYRTVYSASGISVLMDAMNDGGKPLGTSATQPVEDGSIDYCIVCNKHGNLLCCDFCPRAFHAACINYDAKEDQSDTPWECMDCQREKKGFPEESIDGLKSLPLICATNYDVGSDSISNEDLDRLRVLSIIHEMLGRLMSYSFGYIFSNPVDPVQVPTYNKIIKKPMDLGTIASNLENGSYSRRVDGGDLDKVISAVLQDIELVWHNCFTFNFPGSAIYRMAEVQSKAAWRIRAKSFHSLLSERVKQEVQEFVASCQQTRERTNNPSISGPGCSSGPSLQSPTKARHKIAISAKGFKQKGSRPLAVLDPETGMVVKIYSSLQAACAAIELFRSLNYECEWDLPSSDLYNKVRRIVKEGAEDPNYLLFGYRWLWLDDLRRGKVVFEAQDESKVAGCQTELNTSSFADSQDELLKPSASGLIEVLDGGNSHIFGSLELALAHYFKSPEDTEKAKMLLQPLTSDGNFIDYAGRQWRKRSQSATVQLVPQLSGISQPTTVLNGCGLATKSDSSFFKYDAICGRRLAEFSSLWDAYSDWLNALDAYPDSEPNGRNMDVFKCFYLDGERTIAGLMWTTAETVDLTQDPPASITLNSSTNVANGHLNGKLLSSEGPTRIKNQSEFGTCRTSLVSQGDLHVT